MTESLILILVLIIVLIFVIQLRQIIIELKDIKKMLRKIVENKYLNK